MYIRADLLQEFTHGIMEAEKFHDQLSPSWRTKKACGVIQYGFKGLTENNKS